MLDSLMNMPLFKWKLGYSVIYADDQDYYGV